MRTLSRVLLAFGAVALLASVVAAQQPQRGQGRGGFGGIGQLLDNKDVQKDVGLSDDQVEKAKKVAEDVRDKHKDDYAKLQDAPMEERFQKMMELGRQVNTETLKALDDVLKPDQVKRIKQIQLQSMTRFTGPGIFLTPDVEAALKLEDKQKDDLKTMSEDYRKEAQEIRQSAGQGNFQEVAKKMDGLRKESMDNALKVLNDNQKKTWEDLNGKMVDYQIGFGGGRPRQRNQNQ
jgi:hypothetical protein